MKNKLYLSGLFLPLFCFLTFIGFCEYQRGQSYEIIASRLRDTNRAVLSAGH